MRAVTRLSAEQKKVYTKKADRAPRKRGRPKKGEEADKNDAHAVTTIKVMTAKQHKFKSYLCGDLTSINHHIQEREQMKHDQVCSFCGEPAYTRCTVCPEKPAPHFFPAKGFNKEKSCFIDYHNDCCFGLARREFPLLLGRSKREWRPPSDRQKMANGKRIRNLVAEESKATSH
jgi:hypothetical protein